MRANQAREIPIHLYLEQQGIKPAHARRSGGELWYKSPIRSGDNDPSFKVDTNKNLWFDHGIAKGGNALDLVCELHNISVKQALARLAASGLYHAPHSDNLSLFTGGKTPSPTISPLAHPLAPTLAASFGEDSAGEKEKQGGYFEIIGAGDIKNPALIEYLASRFIALDLAKQYMKEIQFKPKNKLSAFFALGWPSGDGFDARSAIFKGFVGTGKDISTINIQDGLPLVVFEGHMDFLAYLTYCVDRKNINPNDLPFSVIILHSTSLRRRAAELIKNHHFSRISLFLDNDNAGLDTADYFKTALPDAQVINQSLGYAKYNDFNDRWIAQNLQTLNIPRGST